NSAAGKGAMATLSKDLGPVESLIALRRREYGGELCVLARHAKGERNYKFRVVQNGQGEKIDWVPDGTDEFDETRLGQFVESLLARRVWVTPLVANSWRRLQVEWEKTQDRGFIIHPHVRRQIDLRSNLSLRNLASADYESITFTTRGAFGAWSGQADTSA